MTPARRRPRRLLPPLVILAATLAAAGLGLSELSSRGARPPAPRPPPTKAGSSYAKLPQRPAGVRAIPLPLPEVDRLYALGGPFACVVGGREVACTSDGGESFTWFGQTAEPVLALARIEGELLAATRDGAIVLLEPGRPAVVRTPPPVDLVVVDAAGTGDGLWLLAHRFLPPRSDLEVARVGATQLLSFEPPGALRPLGALPGHAGERLLAGADGTLTIFDGLSPRAFRSREGGRAFQPVPIDERLAARFGALSVTIERSVERLDGPGRPARARSTALLSRDDGRSWTAILEVAGELYVAFEPSGRGVLIAPGEEAAFGVEPGAAVAVLQRRDARLSAAVDVAFVDDRAIVVTDDGAALIF